MADQEHPVLGLPLSRTTCRRFADAPPRPQRSGSVKFSRKHAVASHAGPRRQPSSETGYGHSSLLLVMQPAKPLSGRLATPCRQPRRRSPISSAESLLVWGGRQCQPAPHGGGGCRDESIQLEKGSPAAFNIAWRRSGRPRERTKRVSVRLARNLGWLRSPGPFK